MGYTESLIIVAQLEVSVADGNRVVRPLGVNHCADSANAWGLIECGLVLVEGDSGCRSSACERK